MLSVLERVLAISLEIDRASDAGDGVLLNQLVGERDRLLSGLSGQVAGSAGEVDLVQRIRRTEAKLMAKWDGQSSAIADILARLRTVSAAREAYGSQRIAGPRVLEETG